MTASARRQLSRAGVLSLALALGSSACSEGLHAPLDAFEQPTGLALSPEGGWLLVTNGDWEQRRDSSSLVAVDLDALDEALSNPAPAGSSLDTETPCRRMVGQLRVECDPEALIVEEHSLRFGRGAVNIAMDTRSPGHSRALIPTRIDAGLTWVDVHESASGELELNCNADLERFCTGEHVREDVGPSPARISIDREGYGFAYLPQVLETPGCSDEADPDCSGMTLVDLEGPKGPRAVDWDADFFREDPIFESDLSGGFAVAQRVCDPDAPADLNRECRRPLLFASQRHWYGVRLFTVAEGVALILSNVHVELVGNNIEAASPLPLNGDLAFIDPDNLLMVHTTPPALSLIDTSVDEDGELANELQASLPLCANPNVLALWQHEGAPELAFVSCYSERRVNVVSLDTFSVTRTLTLGEGPNELLVDEARQRLYVGNVLEDSVSVVSLDNTNAAYLTEVATLALGTSRVAPP